MDATEHYVGKGGELYWQRNVNEGRGRQYAVHSLYELAPGEPWLEVGCGQRWNMGPGDIGLDVDPRVHPHMVCDVREGLPFTDQSFPVVFCVGLLMHFPHKEAHKVLGEMARVARQEVIIGEYVSEIERDKLWDWKTGEFGHGDKGLVWERPYGVPAGYVAGKRVHLPAFGSEVTFLQFGRET